MERKNLESPELRSQHILDLHSSIAELRMRVHAQEEVLTVASDRAGSAVGMSNEPLYNTCLRDPLH